MNVSLRSVAVSEGDVLSLRDGRGPWSRRGFMNENGPAASLGRGVYVPADVL